MSSLARAIAALAAVTLLLPCQAEVTISLHPADPSPADSIVATIHDTDSGCPLVAPQSVITIANEIRLFLSSQVDCGFGPYAEWRLTLGALPPGNYIVSLLRDGTMPVQLIDSKRLQVNLGTTAAKPFQSYAGQWLTQFDGEGLFLEQSGDKAFLAFLTYAEDGRPTWYVVPDARWEYGATERYRFRGALYVAERANVPGARVAATPVGTASWSPDVFDAAMFEAAIGDARITRSLRRFRF